MKGHSPEGWHHRFVTAGLVLCLTISSVDAIEIHVSPSGNDDNPGTASAPFLTPLKARDAIRKLRKAGELESESVLVNLHGGVYQITQTLKLTAADSGTEQAPVIWQAAPGTGEVRFVGGVSLTSWQSVSSGGIRERLAAGARDQVLEIDLKAVGVTDFGMPTPTGGRRAELIYNTKYMTLARYPNVEWLNVAAIPEGGTLVEKPRGSHYGRFQYDGKRPASWADVRDLWVHGY